ncbi:hypothetical protein ES703_63130 [subsurface metagenome]
MSLNQVIISLDDPEMFVKSYKLRRTGAGGQTIELTLPKEVFKREVRRLGLSQDEALKLLNAVWHYGPFRGIYLVFEASEEDANDI